MEQALCQFLDWDTNFFGFRIGRVRSGKLNPGDPEAVYAWCHAEQIRCMYLLGGGGDMITSRLAADYGFRFVDIRHTLETRVGEPPPHPASIRPVLDQDVVALAGIARSAHTDSRFYFDGMFPRQRCDDLYDTWIRKSCLEAYAGAVLVAVTDSRPAGYITCTAQNEIGQIGLIAVADWARGAGHGFNLVSAARSWFHEQGVSQVKVVTQGRNVQAQRLYQRCGFVTSSVELWYHLWPELPRSFPSVDNSLRPL